MKTEWISVNDRLPEKGIVVIVYAPTLVLTGYMNNEQWYQYMNAGEGDMLLKVTHWMPLPEPPPTIMF